MSDSDFILQLRPENFDLLWKADISMFEHNPR